MHKGDGGAPTHHHAEEILRHGPQRHGRADGRSGAVRAEAGRAASAICLEARDRKGQTASHGRADIRISADNNAADQQLARFEKEAGQLSGEAAQADRPAREGQPEDAADGGEVRAAGREDSPGEGGARRPPPRLRRRQKQKPAGNRPGNAQAPGANCGREAGRRGQRPKTQNAAAGAAAFRRVGPFGGPGGATANDAARDACRVPRGAGGLRSVGGAADAAIGRGDEAGGGVEAAGRRLPWPIGSGGASALREEMAVAEPAAQGVGAGAEPVAVRGRRSLGETAARNSCSKRRPRRPANSAQLRDAMAGLQKDASAIGRPPGSSQLDAARAAQSRRMPELAKEAGRLGASKRRGRWPRPASLLQQEGPRRMKPQAQSAGNAESGGGRGDSPRRRASRNAPATPAATAAKQGRRQRFGERRGEERRAHRGRRLYEPALGGPPPKLDPRLAEKRPPPKKAETPSARRRSPTIAKNSTRGNFKS